MSGAAKRGPGRPPLPEGEARSTELRVRVSEADLAALDRVAVALGVDRSEATRRAIAEADKRAQRPARARRVRWNAPKARKVGG